VPWTRLVSTVKTTYHGKKIDLSEYILKHRERLALKPNDDYTGQGSFFGWEMNDASWDRALRQAQRLPYVVQEKVEPAKSVFPVRSEAGGLEFRDMRVDVYPQAYLGRILSCSSWLSLGSAAGFASSAGLAPTFILDGPK